MHNNRRKFIKSISALGVGAATLGPLQTLATDPAPVPNSKMETEQLSENDETWVSILQTTDVHCQIHPHDELFWENEEMIFRKAGGYAYVSAMLNRLKEKNENTFCIDTGDMFQGSELSVKTTGQAFVPVLNAMAYDLYLPGNWEVIYGKKNMQKLMGALQAPKICTNMYHDLGGGKKGELIFQPYHIWQVAGVKIGFLGYTDPLVPIRQSPVYSKGILYTKPEENLGHYVEVLRDQEQCCFIILIAHLGLSQQIALANMPVCEGVNYILGGDTHERVRKPIVCQYAKVVEPGAFGSFIGKLDLLIADGQVKAERYELMEVNPTEIRADRDIQSLLSTQEKAYQDDINKVIGYSTIPLYRYFVIENPIDTLVLDALRWKFPDVDIVLSNGFRFCPPRTTPDESGNIPLTHGFVYDMLPVDSRVRIAKATGSQIKDWIEKELNNVFSKDASMRFGGWVVKFNGMKITFNAFGENGKRVQSMTINETAVDDKKFYSLLACEREGDPEDMLCRMKGVKDAFNTESTLHQLMISYISTHSPVTPIPQKSAIALDAPATLLSQVSGIDYRFE